jgi:hypothetical protein
MILVLLNHNKFDFDLFTLKHSTLVFNYSNFFEKKEVTLNFMAFFGSDKLQMTES